MYPLAVIVKQFRRHATVLGQSFGDIDQATNLALGSSGTQYFVNRPGIISVSADGLASAITEGDVTVTIINGPAEVTVPVRVQTPRDGVVSVATEGGVVRGTDGSTVAIPPGVLTNPTDVSIALLHRMHCHLRFPMDLTLPAHSMLTSAMMDCQFRSGRLAC